MGAICGHHIDALQVDGIIKYLAIKVRSYMARTVKIHRHESDGTGSGYGGGTSFMYLDVQCINGISQYTDYNSFGYIHNKCITVTNSRPRGYTARTLHNSKGYIYYTNDIVRELIQTTTFVCTELAIDNTHS